MEGVYEVEKKLKIYENEEKNWTMTVTPNKEKPEEEEEQKEEQKEECICTDGKRLRKSRLWRMLTKMKT